MHIHIVCPWRARALLLLFGGLSALCAAAAPAAASDDDDIEALRQEIAALRSEYQDRLSALETRLEATERRYREVADQAAQAAAAPAAAVSASAPSLAGVSNDTSFNPAIGVILEGQLWHADRDPDAYRIPGFPLGGEAAPVPRGLALGESEVDFTANVDDLFTAWLTAPIVVEDGETSIEIEEAWVETLGLPAGLSARFGRFFSGIGYLNGKHSHAWDFIDQPLVYQAFLGNQYIDDGVQLRWLAPTAVYLELGAELLRGDRYPAGGAGDNGIGAESLFVRAGGDVGAGSSWQTGLSYLHAQSRERESGPEASPLLFSGDSDLVVAEFVWKWAPQGNWRERNLVFQSELLWRNENGRYLIGDTPVPIDDDQTGWYAQLVYQPIPQWRVGARYDRLSSDDPGLAFQGSDLDPGGDDPERCSVMVDWSHSEFSRIRLQYSRDLSGPGDDDQWGLQYIHSIGAHGAHSF